MVAVGASVLAACALGAVEVSSAHGAAKPIPTVTGDAKVDALLAKMTLDEKLALVAGQAEAASADNQHQAGYLPGIPRLGIPSLTLSDGPPGVITKQTSTGMTATMGVAATFSATDARKNGVVIGRDDKALGQNISLQPFVNLDRDTSWGRGFNTFGEDPLLTSNMGAAEVKGIQSQGTMAQIKHYIAYDGSNNVDVDQQTLHEIYLAPFAAAVKANVASIMCSYNLINGYQSCDNAQNLTAILRNELGFKGFVTSDWGATHSTTNINAGLDMQMPSGTYFGAAALKTAIANGSVQKSRITEAVGRILYEEDQLGLLDNGAKHNVTPEKIKANAKVVQKTGEDAAVLLKNKANALPLSSTSLSSLALIGPGAGQTIATNGGGEKSGGRVDRQIGTYQVLGQQLAGNSSAHLTYAVADDMTGIPVPASALSHNGGPGLVRTSNGTTSVDEQVNFTHSNNASLPAATSATWTGTITAPQDGSYWLNLQLLGATGSLTVDGTQVVSARARYGVLHATDGNGPLPTTDGLANERGHVTLTKGAHTISITDVPDLSNVPVEVRLNWVTPSQQAANTAAAVAAAKNAATAVVFAWSGGDLSSALPEGQDDLINAVAKVNKHTVVVLNTSQPIAMPWASKVKAILEMWYPGDEGGTATANVLTGVVNPDGRLPFTWPASLDQEPSHQVDAPQATSAGVDSSGKLCTAGSGGGPNASGACTTTYSEGVDVGYRFYAAHNEKPLYPFGYGLSYSTFKYSAAAVARAGDGGLTVSFTATNTGDVAGDTTPQVYLGAPVTQPAGVQFAPIALAGFARTTLGAGQSTTVSVHVPLRSLQYWSTSAGWTTATGQRTVMIGKDATSTPLKKKINISS